MEEVKQTHALFARTVQRGSAGFSGVQRGSAGFSGVSGRALRFYRPRTRPRPRRLWERVHPIGLLFSRTATRLFGCDGQRSSTRAITVKCEQRDAKLSAFSQTVAGPLNPLNPLNPSSAICRKFH
jgi:hypothetical protein